jgi:hypothetical protein
VLLLVLFVFLLLSASCARCCYCLCCCVRTSSQWIWHFGLSHTGWHTAGHTGSSHCHLHSGWQSPSTSTSLAATKLSASSARTTRMNVVFICAMEAGSRVDTVLRITNESRRDCAEGQYLASAGGQRKAEEQRSEKGTVAFGLSIASCREFRDVSHPVCYSAVKTDECKTVQTMPASGA